MNKDKVFGEVYRLIEYLPYVEITGTKNNNYSERKGGVKELSYYSLFSTISC